MAQVTITTVENTDKVDIICNPSLGSTKSMRVSKTNVVKLRLLDLPDVLDLVKIYYADGEVNDLHFSVGVKVDGEVATSNQDLYDKLNAIFT